MATVRPPSFPDRIDKWGRDNGRVPAQVGYLAGNGRSKPRRMRTICALSSPGESAVLYVAVVVIGLSSSSNCTQWPVDTCIPQRVHNHTDVAYVYGLHRSGLQQWPALGFCWVLSAEAGIGKTQITPPGNFLGGFARVIERKQMEAAQCRGHKVSAQIAALIHL